MSDEHPEMVGRVATDGGGATDEALTATAVPPAAEQEAPKKKRGRPKLPKNDDGSPKEPMGRGCALGDPQCEAERIHDWPRAALDADAKALTLCAAHAKRLAQLRPVPFSD